MLPTSLLQLQSVNLTVCENDDNTMQNAIAILSIAASFENNIYKSTQIEG